MSDHDQEIKETPGARLTKFAKRRDVLLATAWGIFFTGVFVVLGAVFYPKWMPEVMSSNMNSTERLIEIFTYISAPVCGVVLGISMHTFLQRKRGNAPTEDGPATRTNGPIVVGWTIVSSVLALVAVIYGLTAMNADATAAAKDSTTALQVNVVGQQWAWNFEYPSLGVNSTQLYLPINKPVQFNVISKDVNHSFWPVQLGVKVDANPVVYTVTNTVPNKLGKFDVRCAELCGIYHSYMQTTGDVVTESDFNNWVTSNGGHVA
jgi:cytochrome c oxidase subunit II